MKKKQTSWRGSHLDGIALGAFLATIFFLVIFWQLDVVKESTNRTTLYAAIIGAAVALFVGCLALKGVTSQIQQNIDADEERRARALAAAIALLPIALSRLSEIAANNSKRNFDQALLLKNEELEELQYISDDIIEVLKESIEHSDTLSQERLAQLFRMYQVLIARDQKRPLAKICEQTSEWQRGEHEALSSALNWTVFYAIVGSAYGYARGVQASIPPAITTQHVYNALNNLGINYESVPKLVLLIEERANAGRLEMSFGQGW